VRFSVFDREQTKRHDALNKFGTFGKASQAEAFACYEYSMCRSSWKEKGSHMQLVQNQRPVHSHRMFSVSVFSILFVVLLFSLLATPLRTYAASPSHKAIVEPHHPIHRASSRPGSVPGSIQCIAIATTITVQGPNNYHITMGINNQCYSYGTLTNGLWHIDGTISCAGGVYQGIAVNGSFTSLAAGAFRTLYNANRTAGCQINGQNVAYSEVFQSYADGDLPNGDVGYGSRYDTANFPA